MRDRNLAALIGSDVYDRDGEKVGRIGQVFVDPDSGRANWVTVKTGLFGRAESFVPVDQAREADDTVQVPYSKDVVKHAPRIDADGELSSAEEDELYAYYRSPDEGEGTSEHADRREDDRDRPRDEAREHRRDQERERAGDVADEDLVPTAEPSGQRVPRGSARLVRYVVTEEQTVTVPVTREEVRLESDAPTPTQRRDHLGDEDDGRARGRDDVAG